MSTSCCQSFGLPRVYTFLKTPCIHVVYNTYYISYIQGVSKKTLHSWETKILGTSYSETSNQLDLKLWQQGVLMSTPCCQSLKSNGLVVLEYEVPKVGVSQECKVFFETPVIFSGKKGWCFGAFVA